MTQLIRLLLVCCLASAVAPHQALAFTHSYALIDSERTYLCLQFYKVPGEQVDKLEPGEEVLFYNGRVVECRLWLAIDVRGAEPVFNLYKRSADGRPEFWMTLGLLYVLPGEVSGSQDNYCE